MFYFITLPPFVLVITLQLNIYIYSGHPSIFAEVLPSHPLVSQSSFSSKFLSKKSWEQHRNIILTTFAELLLIALHVRDSLAGNKILGSLLLSYRCCTVSRH